MCGIVGAFGNLANAKQVVASATGLLHHRGPDHSAVWTDAQAQVTLGHARLAILDLSSAGHQPMVSACRRFVIALNGEIYNHLDLRKQLGATAWRGHSDTETLLACFSDWGVERTLRATVGMFAFALWDRRDRTLVLARDRLGEKPLYYGYLDDAFVFASELKAIRGLTKKKPAIDRNALALYTRYGLVPAPHSIYAGIRKLRAGSWLTVTSRHLEQKELPPPVSYWDLMEIAERGCSHPRSYRSSDAAVTELEGVLAEAVKGQMIADVPLGAFLSGGVDSSLIVAMMQKQSRDPVKTFTIGFCEDDFDEAKHASAVARYLRTDHTELYITADDAQAVIPKLPQIYCEPFSDSSQIPTFLVAKLAREKVKVSLSGDGGDELFAGYPRYTLAERAWASVSKVPGIARRLGSIALRGIPVAVWNHLSFAIRPVLPQTNRAAIVGDKIHKAADLLLTSSDREFYVRGFMSYWRPEELGLRLDESHADVHDTQIPVSFAERMMALDTMTYLPDDILVKVDRAAMAVSLETRVPLLDHRVVEFAWSLPVSLKIRGACGKWLLRQVLYRHVPRHLVERPKMGFGLPLDSWLRGPLRDWGEALLDDSRIRREGYFHAGPIRRKWEEHLTGRRNWHRHLWAILMFQAWAEAYA